MFVVYWVAVRQHKSLNIELISDVWYQNWTWSFTTYTSNAFYLSLLQCPPSVWLMFTLKPWLVKEAWSYRACNTGICHWSKMEIWAMTREGRGKKNRSSRIEPVIYTNFFYWRILKYCVCIRPPTPVMSFSFLVNILIFYIVHPCLLPAFVLAIIYEDKNIPVWSKWPLQIISNSQ